MSCGRRWKCAPLSWRSPARLTRWREMENCLRLMKTAVKASDVETYIVEALRLHRHLIVASHNRTFVAVWDSLHWDVRGRIAVERLARKGGGFIALIELHEAAAREDSRAGCGGVCGAGASDLHAGVGRVSVRRRVSRTSPDAHSALSSRAAPPPARRRRESPTEINAVERRVVRPPVLNDPIARNRFEFRPGFLRARAGSAYSPAARKSPAAITAASRTRNRARSRTARGAIPRRVRAGAHPIAHRTLPILSIDVIHPGAAQILAGARIEDRQRKMRLLRPRGDTGLDEPFRLRDAVARVTPRQPAAHLRDGFHHRGVHARSRSSRSSGRRVSTPSVSAVEERIMVKPGRPGQSASDHYLLRGTRLHPQSARSPHSVPELGFGNPRFTEPPIIPQGTRELASTAGSALPRSAGDHGAALAPSRQPSGRARRRSANVYPALHEALLRITNSTPSTPPRADTSFDSRAPASRTAPRAATHTSIHRDV